MLENTCGNNQYDTDSKIVSDQQNKLDMDNTTKENVIESALKCDSDFNRGKRNQSRINNIREYILHFNNQTTRDLKKMKDILQTHIADENKTLIKKQNRNKDIFKEVVQNISKIRDVNKMPEDILIQQKSRGNLKKRSIAHLFSSEISYDDNVDGDPSYAQASIQHNNPTSSYELSVHLNSNDLNSNSVSRESIEETDSGEYDSRTDSFETQSITGLSDSNSQLDSTDYISAIRSSETSNGVSSSENSNSISLRESVIPAGSTESSLHSRSNEISESTDSGELDMSSSSPVTPAGSTVSDTPTWPDSSSESNDISDSSLSSEYNDPMDSSQSKGQNKSMESSNGSDSSESSESNSSISSEESDKRSSDPRDQSNSNSQHKEEDYDLGDATEGADDVAS
ncbi:Hypothetical predicted protein [Pelobates cultripes]|uniref:Uncharacterized protein n=1 Tax=Pelobates cultripes TaxID=61616 RepID=A0AAD1SGY4_PELCU|nr:Hypothetical predicted protein [Pelobates cultripes]